jgi:hypothetical protein
VKDAITNPASEQPPQWLDQLQRCIRDKHYSVRTKRIYVYWARWYIRFHGLRHPMQMGATEIQAFLSYLANERNASVSTHHQALCALLFLYKNVLQIVALAGQGPSPGQTGKKASRPVSAREQCLRQDNTIGEQLGWEIQSGKG